MQVEYDALMKNNTWSLVPFSHSLNVVGNKWVYRVKYNKDDFLQKYKARLVAKGFHQTPEVDFFETFSPVVKASTIRVVLSLAVSFHWQVQQIDINNAFLNGDLKEVIYMKQPDGFVSASHTDYVCHLHKSLYSLKQAPRA
ncbi:hypothetical protein ACOSQ2_022184 [Xanthoceras sorbifolium]